MRVVGGMWRGHPLEAPSGQGVTRPTTDRVREAEASMVMSSFGLDLSSVSVLDAFAGSGAMGIELLSRGASHATFVDRDRGAVSRVGRNLRAVGAGDASYDILLGDTAARMSAAFLAGGPFDVIVLDPPYAMSPVAVGELVASARAAGNLAPDAVVLYERASASPALTIEGFVMKKQKRYGTTSVDLLRRGEEDA